MDFIIYSKQADSLAFSQILQAILLQSFLLKSKTRRSFEDRLLQLKYSTRENYRAALNRFERFCEASYPGKASMDVIQELGRIPAGDRDDAYFDLLQDYVNWLVSLGLSNATVTMYLQIVTYYFSYHGIRAHGIDIRQNVRRPRKIRERLHALTKEEILEVFKQAPEKRKMLYLVLAGSGMRIQECVALRKKDFDLDHPKRIKVEIPARFTKAMCSHTTFVSMEASVLLQPYLESLEVDDLVFATNPNPFHAKMTEIEAFARYRKKAGLTARYESTGRHHVSLHSFRSYFFTRARRMHDTDVAHAMVGHTTYLDMYDRKEDWEKLELYLKVEPELSLL